jgi:hypothetical protein
MPWLGRSGDFLQFQAAPTPILLHPLMLTLIGRCVGGLALIPGSPSFDWPKFTDSGLKMPPVHRRVSAVFVGVVLLGMAGAASAQHPCDVVQPRTGTVAQGALPYLAFCQRASDQIAAVTVYRDGIPTQYSNLVLNTPTPSASGKVQYYLALNPLAPGQYVVTVASINAAGEGPRSLSFTVTIEGAPPPPPPPPTGCLFNGQLYPVGAVVSKTVSGGTTIRNRFVKEMTGLGWVLTNKRRVSASVYTYTFRCGG